MVIKFNFGKTNGGDVNKMLVELGNIITGMTVGHNLTFGSCNIYINFYDEDGRRKEIMKPYDPPVKNPRTGKEKWKQIGFLFRNKRFTRNENTEEREYYGEENGLYKYLIYEDATVEEM